MNNLLVQPLVQRRRESSAGVISPVDMRRPFRLWMTGSVAVVMAAMIPLRDAVEPERSQALRVLRHSRFTVSETLQPENYFEKFVGQLDERTAIIIDPMLATAGSMIATVSLLKARGCKDIRALVLVAAPEGVAALAKAHPDVRCWTASIDSHLNELGYIIPGLGDAGDKIFGTK